MQTAVFADYDGTITDADTFDVLVRACAGDAVWDEIEARLERGERTLSEAMQAEAGEVRLSFEDALALLERKVRFDPAFPDYAARCRAAQASLTVVSSGIEPLIRLELERHGVGYLPVVASGLEVTPAGWRLIFRDGPPNGTDKAALVRAAHERGARTVFIGDGRSDFDAALVAEVVFAKRGRRLERFLRERARPFTPFKSFAEIRVPASVT